jgi:hypothetical protein
MKREVELIPATTFINQNPKALWPGSSGYESKNTPSVTLHEAWTSPLESHWGPAGQFTLVSKAAIGFEPPPTLVTDYSQYGPNNWYFPPDNAHGPRLKMMMRGREGGWLYGTEHTISTDFKTLNVNRRTTPNKWAVRTDTWALTSHPEGGPFTFEDMFNLVAGVEMRFSDGPGGKPFFVGPRNFSFRVRVAQFTAHVEVIDLGGFVENVRAASSMSLRLMRRARNMILPVTFADQAVGDVGSRVYMSHPEGPSVDGNGWGQRRLERRPGIILKRTIQPETFSISDEVYDLPQYACLGWGVYRIDGPWSPELQGVGLIDKGNGFVHTRKQDGWSSRPGDGVVMRVPDDFPNVSFNGLAAQGGGDLSICLRNYDMMQAGWATVGSSGTFSATQDTTVYMAEELGFLSSTKLEYGAGGGQGGRERSLGALPYNSGDLLHVRVLIKNTSVPTPATQNGEWSLRRTDGGLPAQEWWDDSTRTWTTTETDNDIPSDEAFGLVEVDAIPLDAGAASSDPTYYIRIGRFSANLSSVTLHGAIVDAQHTDNTVGGVRTPIVTLSAAITRVADVHKLTNKAGDDQLWDYTRGVAVGEFRPFWRASDLPANQVRPILHAKHGNATYDAVQFVRQSGVDANVVWQDVEGCTVSGNQLTKTAATGWHNASARSTGELTHGHLEYTIQNDTDYVMVGLADSDLRTHAERQSGLAHAIYRFPPSGLGLVWEYDDTPTDVGSISAGDVVRIQVDTDDKVRFYVNGTLKNTRDRLGSAPYRVGTVLYNNGAVVNQVKLSSPHLIRFERAVVSQTTYQLDCEARVDLSRDHVVRAWARWLGADGWREYAPWSVQAGFAVFLESDGSLIRRSSILGTLSYQGNVSSRESLAIGYDDTPRYLDGYVRLWETRRNPISELEAIWRI